MRKKKIIVDDEIFSIQDNYGGISRLIVEYLKMFETDDDIEFIVPFKYSNNKHLNITNYRKKKFFPNFKFYKKYKILRFVNKFNINKIIAESNYDALLLSYLDNNLALRNKKKLISVIHDTIHEDNSNFFKNINNFKNLKKNILEKSDAVISVSNETKKNLVRLYNINEKKIYVVHPHNKTNVNIEKFNLPENFILYVGNREGYKNFNFLINCISINKFNIVCVGGKKFSKDEIRLFKKKGLLNKIHHFQLNDNQLNYAYQKAICHIIVSEAEGFGLTILEALKNNCKVLCPKLPIFKEVGKDSIFYFKLNDVNDFNFQLLKIINKKYDKEIYQKMKFNLKNFNLLEKKKELKRIFLTV